MDKNTVGYDQTEKLMSQCASILSNSYKLMSRKSRGYYAAQSV